MLLISYKIIKNPMNLDKDFQKNSSSVDLIDIGRGFDMEHSWLYQINEDRGKDYSFAKIEIELELN